MKIVSYIFIGGGVGAVARYALSKYISGVYEGLFPIATLFINVVGCFLIGIFLGILLKYGGQNEIWKALLITGFCGGFTTFSTFSLENITLIQKGEHTIMLFYTALSMILGLFFTYLGLLLMK